MPDPTPPQTVKKLWSRSRFLTWLLVASECSDSSSQAAIFLLPQLLRPTPTPSSSNPSSPSNQATTPPPPRASSIWPASDEPTTLDWGLKARLAMAENRPEEALAALAQVPDDHALASWARLSSGQLELRRNRLPTAESFLKQALELDPTLVPARRELIYILAMQTRREELDQAFEDLSEHSKLTYRERWIWCMVPDLIWWIPGEHLEALEPCLEADPTDRWTRLALAEDLRRLARYGQAESILEPLPALDPEAQALRAQLALEQGDAKKAAEIVRTGALDHPGLARLRGQLAMSRRETDEALHQFQLAYDAQPDRRESASNLGRALLLAGKEEEARPYLQAVEKLDYLSTLLLRAEKPEGANDQDLLKNLGAACEAVGRLPEARAWYGLAIESDPLDRQAQQALYRLKPSQASELDPFRP